MIYMTRHGRGYLATGDTVLELDAYVSVLEGASPWLPREADNMVVAHITRPAGTYRKLGERAFVIAACVLGSCIEAEHGRILQLDRADPFYQRYVRWCMRKSIALPIEHLPARRHTNTKAQVSAAVLELAIDGAENGERVGVTYLCGRLPNVARATVAAELKQLAAAGYLEQYRDGIQTLYRLPGGDPF